MLSVLPFVQPWPLCGELRHVSHIAEPIVELGILKLDNSITVSMEEFQFVVIIIHKNEV